MKTPVFSVVAAAAIAVAGLWGWHAWSPSPEKAIRHRLADLARTASYGPNEGALAKVLDGDQVAGFFAPDAEVRLDLGAASVTSDGRDKLRDALISAKSLFTSLKVDFLDVSVTVGPDRQSAEVDLTAMAKIPGEQDPEVFELKFLMKQIRGDWMIRRVETVKVLR